MIAKNQDKSGFRTYRAHASVKSSSPAAAVQAAFKIDVRFTGGLNATQMSAFEKAADRWSRVITGDLPSVVVNGEVIDDVMIMAEGSDIDGPGKVLGQAGPRTLRPDTLLPATGIMSFDTADLANMEANGTLVDVITHEMGHVLGIGTLWHRKGLVVGTGTANPRFKGPLARKEYGDLRGTQPRHVPIEDQGGPGSREGHWRDSLFGDELMSSFIAGAKNPLSRLTIACLQDLGYQVDLSAAEPYTLPDLVMMAEAGQLRHDHDHGHCLPIIPRVLPKESLDVP